MDRFKTQFMMSEVRTYVTIDPLADQTFGCTLNLLDFFEGDEIPTDNVNYDLTIKENADGIWEQFGNAKVHLRADDLQRLGKAIKAVI